MLNLLPTYLQTYNYTNVVDTYSTIINSQKQAKPKKRDIKALEKLSEKDIDSRSENMHDRITKLDLNLPTPALSSHQYVNLQFLYLIFLNRFGINPLKSSPKSDKRQKIDEEEEKETPVSDSNPTKLWEILQSSDVFKYEEVYCICCTHTQAGVSYIGCES